MKFEVGLGFLKIPPEHFHALLVHFPIALWSLAFVFFIFSFSGKFKLLEFPACLMGLCGSLFGFLAMKSGQKSVEILGNQICAFDLVDLHEKNGQTTLIFFVGSFLLLACLMLAERYVFKKGFPLVLRILPLLGMTLGTAYLLKTGHQGYRLVYQHGVGVTKDSLSCK